MTPQKPMTFRLPDSTRGQVLELSQLHGMTQVQVMVVAIDRMYREETLKEKSERE